MVELPAEGKRDLEAAISAAGDSDDPGVYLSAFLALGKLLFNAEADKRKIGAQGPDSFERTLIDDVVPTVIESIFPDKGSVSDIGSDHRKPLSIRHDLSTGILSEREPGGNWDRPSREVQALYARLSYWDEFAPASARLALYDSPKRYEKFREALRQHLERQALLRIHRFNAVAVPAPIHEPSREPDDATDAAMTETAESTPDIERLRRMKPDWNLMRQIVLAVENSTTAGLPAIDGYSQDEVGYHAHLLIGAGLAEGYSVGNNGHRYPHDFISSLTADGHEFAELARDDARWSDAMARARSAGAVTFDILKHLLANPRRGIADEQPVPIGDPPAEPRTAEGRHTSNDPSDAGSATEYSDMPKRSDRLPIASALKNVLKLGAVQCDPLFWRRFNNEKTSNTSPLRETLIHTVIGVTVPKEFSNRDVVELIAAKSEIPIESLSTVLNEPIFSRARTMHGFVGDEFDQIARDYEGMQWWLSDNGLNMDIVSPATPQRAPTFDELVGRPMLAEPTEIGKQRRRGKPDPVVARIKKKVRELKKEGLDYRSICERLGAYDRPPRASWRDLPWPRAYMKHNSAVTKWLSEACAKDHS
ncbi:MAG: DUF2513 domain-containing protein [Bryobacteraceae bacterium]|jgi:hypothetical protein